MINEFKDLKNKKEVAIFKDFMKPDITWDDILSFLFQESLIENNQLAERVLNIPTVESYGNIQIQDKFWLAPQTSYLFDKFKNISDLLYIVNGKKENKECGYYKNGRCDCEVVWHSQGVRISLSNRFVSSHNDPHDILYWQILGTSDWKINDGEVYRLYPGDLFYFSQEDLHAVWCDGPRAGIIIDGIDLLLKK